MEKWIQLNTDLLRAIIRCSKYSIEEFFVAIGQPESARINYMWYVTVSVSLDKLYKLEKGIEDLLPMIVDDNKFLQMLKVKIQANALKAGWLGIGSK
jgi:hypothetical protein